MKQCTKCKAVYGSAEVWMPCDTVYDNAEGVLCDDCRADAGGWDEPADAGEIADMAVKFKDSENNRIKLEWAKKSTEYVYHIWTKVKIADMEGMLKNIFGLSNASIEYVEDMMSWCVIVPCTDSNNDGVWDEEVPALIMQI